MSLASRAANLFFAGSPGTGQEDSNDVGLVNDGQSRGNGSMSDGILEAVAYTPHTMHSQTIEEEGRPPYLHVSSIIPSSKDNTDSFQVHDCWRNRRHYWRSLNALFGYCEDSPARRSAHSAEVCHNVFILFYHSTTRGYSTRALRRVASCYAWILSWHNHIFWNL
jgi:hypothetical protein